MSSVPLSAYVDLQISADTRTITRAGFGVPLLVGYHAAWPDRVREYSDASEMLDDGFTSASPLYAAALVLTSQSPRPPTFKIGRRVGAPTHTVRLTPTSAAEGTTYAGKIGGVAWTRTAPAASSIAAECTAIAAAINALTGAFTATAAATHVDVVGDGAGAFWAHTETTRTIALEDRTALPATSLQTDLAAIAEADAAWYGLAIVDACSEAQIADAAVWASAQKILYVAASLDSSILDPGSTTDIASDERALARRNVSIWYSRGAAHAGFAAGLLGMGLPYTPGSETWAIKEIVGVPTDDLTTTEANAAFAKNANAYQLVAGRGVTRKDAVVASGEKIDVVRFIDWCEARIKEDVFAVLATTPKVPYTGSGFALVASAIRGVIDQGIEAGGIDNSAGNEPRITIPRAATRPTDDRAARNATGLRFAFRLAGAIHQAVIRGTATV